MAATQPPHVMPLMVIVVLADAAAHAIGAKAIAKAAMTECVFFIVPPLQRQVLRVPRERRCQDHDDGRDPEHGLPEAIRPRHLAGLARSTGGLLRPVREVEGAA